MNNTDQIELTEPERRRIPDPQIRESADQYYAASELLRKLQPESALVFPEINCAIMSVELYLKSLAASTVYTTPNGPVRAYVLRADPDRKHHKLEELFEAIPDEIRRTLEEWFDSNATLQTTLTFREMLRTFEGLFVQSRYPFEAGTQIANYSLKDLHVLATALKSIIDALPPKDILIPSRSTFAS